MAALSLIHVKYYLKKTNNQQGFVKLYKRKGKVLITTANHLLALMCNTK